MEENQVKNNNQSEIMFDSGIQQFNNSSKLPKGIPFNQPKNISKRVNTNGADSRLSNSNINKHNPNDKYEKTISHLNNVINKQKKKVREIKNLYMKQVGSRSEL